MSVNLSTGFVNSMASHTGARRLLSNCYLAYFTGTQPASADSPPGGQRIIEFTKAGGSFTGETRPEWKFTLGGASGSLNTVKIGGSTGWDILGGAVSFITDLTTTAAAVAAQINNNIAAGVFTARSSGADVYVKGPRGAGALLNSMTIVTTVTTMTATVAGDGTASGSGGTAGVTAVNGCNFQAPSSGVISKETSTWQGTAGNTRTGGAISGFTSGNLTAGFVRIYCDPADDDSLSTTYARIDMSIGTANADVIANPSATIAYGSVQTINTFSITLPKS